MAGSRAGHSFCRNLPSTGEDKHAGAAPGAFTNNNGTHSHTPAVSRVPAPAPTSAIILAPTEAAAKYTDKDLQ